jgi:hypothetical protein
MSDTPEEEVDLADSELRVDRTAFSVVSLDDDSEKRYWHSRTPAERLRHAQILRRITYGPAADGSLERTLEIVPIEPRSRSLLKISCV